ncbi:unnamed protein product [Thlaspi arvense]|uniref:Phytosulfokine n=1 Tax=Thlaspi arvense TaxID=13288 RepID=A0AAU9RXP9_THLAR|nr:unnamed protein product [Thlaspi arvense]
MAKVSAFCMLGLILLFGLTCAARSGPASGYAGPVKKQHGGDVEVDGESCEGMGEEECLMRRTLAAHVDYIYTQKHNP